MSGAASCSPSCSPPAGCTRRCAARARLARVARRLLRGGARGPRRGPARARRRPLADGAHGPAPGARLRGGAAARAGARRSRSALRARRGAPARAARGVAARGRGVGWAALAALMAVSQLPAVYDATAAPSARCTWPSTSPGWPPRSSSGALVAGADPVPHRPGPARARCSTCCSSRRRWRRPAPGSMWSSAPWYARPLAGRPARRGRAHARRRRPGAGGDDRGRGLGGDPARARRQVALRGGGGPVRRLRRPLRRALVGLAVCCAAHGGVVGRPRAGQSQPRPPRPDAARAHGPRARALRRGLRLLPRRGPARARRARARRCAAPARRRPTSTSRPGACRWPTRPTSPTRAQPALPARRHRRARRLRRLARRARASRASTRAREHRRPAWRRSPSTAPAATRSSARGGHRHRRGRAAALDDTTPTQIAEASASGPT